MRIRMMPLLFALVFAGYSGRGQEVALESYSSGDGLPEGALRFITQDSRGFLWIASDGGVSRFDGVKFTNVEMEGSVSLKRSRWLGESRRNPGAMLIVTNDGACAFDGKESSILPTPKGLSSLVELENGTLLGSTQAGIVRMRPSGEPAIDNSIGPVASLIRSPSGRIYALSSRGVFVLDEPSWAWISVRPATAGDAPSAMAADAGGTLWIGTRSGWLYCLPPTGSVDSTRIGSGVVEALAPEPGTGRLWLAESSRLVLVSRTPLALRILRILDSRNRVSVPSPSTLFVDREGNLWMGTAAGGLMKLGLGGTYTFFRSDLSATSSGGMDGSVWALARSSLVQFRPSVQGGVSATEYPLATGMSPRTLRVGPDGRLWVLYEEGVLEAYAARGGLLQPITTIVLAEPNAPAPGGGAMACDLQGRIWYTTALGGLAAISTRIDITPTVLRYDGPAQIPVVAPSLLTIDRDGGVWVAGRDSGLAVLRTGAPWSRVVRNGHDPGPVIALHGGPDGAVWVGTRSGAILRYEDGMLEPVGEGDALPGGTIAGFAAEPHGRVWAATNRGVATWNQTTRTWWHSERLSNTAVMEIGWTGSLLFMLRGSGIRFFDHQDQKLIPEIPDVVISRVQVHAREKDAAALLRLSDDENTIRIEYAGVTFRNPGEVHYLYELEGVRLPMEVPTGDRAVWLTHLLPGQYTFRVSAVTPWGAVSARPAEVTFAIVPPLWRRWWFIAVCAAVVVLALIMLEVARVRHLVQIEKTRTEIITSLHDEIGEGMSRIALVVEATRPEIQPEAAVLQTAMEGIGETARDILDAAGTLLWVIDPRHAGFDEVLLYVKSYAQEKFRQGNIDYQFSVDQRAQRLRLGMLERKNILLILREGITNVVRHARCRHAAIAVRVVDDSLVITVVDDGAGIEEHKLVTGQGIAAMRSRAAAIGGTTEIRSTQTGTVIMFTLPL